VLLDSLWADVTKNFKTLVVLEELSLLSLRIKERMLADFDNPSGAHTDRGVTREEVESLEITPSMLFDYLRHKFCFAGSSR
jgi:hypothetical protein